MVLSFSLNPFPIFKDAITEAKRQADIQKVSVAAEMILAERAKMERMLINAEKRRHVEETYMTRARQEDTSEVSTQHYL